MSDVLNFLVDSANHPMENWTSKKLGECQNTSQDV
jgi:hypothetical protein